MNENDTSVRGRPHYFATTDEGCTHYGCEGPAWYRLIAWNGLSVDGFCPWHAADWDRRGLARLDRSFHTGTDHHTTEQR